MGAIRTIRKAAKAARTIKRYRTLRQDVSTLKTSASAIFRPKLDDGPADEAKIRGTAMAVSKSAARLRAATSREPVTARSAGKAGMKSLKVAGRIFGATVLFRMARACFRTLR